MPFRKPDYEQIAKLKRKMDRRQVVIEKYRRIRIDGRDDGLIKCYNCGTMVEIRYTRVCPKCKHFVRTT